MSVITGGYRTGDLTTRKYDANGTLLWSVDHGGHVFAVASDTDGNVYTGGARTNVIGGIYATTRKYDSGGNLLWSADYGDTVWGIAVDSLGNVYTGGEYSIGNPTTIKYDANGNVLWSKSHGADVYAIAVDASGSVYIAGGYPGSTWPDGRYHVRKLDTEGNIVWSADTGNLNASYAVAVGTDGSVYSGGALGSDGYTMRKWDASGGLVWGVNSGATVRGIAVDSDNNVYAVGMAAGTTILEYNSGGSLVWSATHGAYVYGVAIDSDDNLYIGGSPETEGLTTRKYSGAHALLWSASHGAHVYGAAISPDDSSGGGGITRGRRVPEFTVSIFRRDFTGGLLVPDLRFRAELMSWTALGGCDLATVRATGREGALWDLADMLRCPVEILDQDGVAVWWGYVNSASIDFGRLAFGVNLDSMANKVAVAYAYQGSGVAGVSGRATTGWAEDTDSTGEYGSFERLESLSDAGSVEAETRRDALLEALRWPVPEIDFTASGLSGTLECRGWFHTLKRRYYANAGTTDTDTGDQIAAIIDDCGDEFFRGYVIETSSGIDTNEYRDGDSNAWQIITDLLESGVDGEDVRLLAQVTRDRVLRVYQEPDPGLTDARLYSDGDLSDSFGTPVRIGPELVGRHARLMDAIPPYVNLSRVADPTRVFVERAEYDVERVRLRPQPRGNSIYRVSRVEAG